MKKKEFNAEKKIYKQPTMKVVEIDNCDIICQSPTARGRSNESYEEEDEDVINDWFN